MTTRWTAIVTPARASARQRGRTLTWWRRLWRDRVLILVALPGLTLLLVFHYLSVRKPVSSWDDVLSQWKAAGGDQVRTEFEQALQRGGG